MTAPAAAKEPPSATLRDEKNPGAKAVRAERNAEDNGFSACLSAIFALGKNGEISPANETGEADPP